ncbi:hypothetical protein AAG906_000320 [Vitis piasezkii]
MSLRSAKTIWDYLKTKYEGDERIRGMQVLNLIRDFELQKMKETESIKGYYDRLLDIANRVILLGSSLPNSRIVEKILVTMLKRFEASIIALENTKDLSMITLSELLNALQAQEQRRVMRRVRKHQGSNGEYTNNNNKSKTGNKKEPHPPYQHCGGKSHPAPNATRWGMKLSYAKTKISNMVKRYRLLIKRRINCLCLNVSLAWNQVRVGSLTMVALTICHIESIQGTKKHKHVEGSNWKSLVHNRGRKWNSCNFKLFRYKVHF